MADEIKVEARQAGVPPSTVEKDYMISVVLRELWMSGIWRNLVFKGGTALRKVYFPDYRFSEDMDFNLVDGNAGDIMETLVGLERCKGEIEFLEPEMRERFGKRYHIGRIVGYEIRIPYYFLRKTGEPAKIRMDLSVGDYERMALEPVERGIFHTYSDEEAFSRVRVLSYSLEELMTEKIRTIFQRTGRPRDIYDIWYLSRYVDMGVVLSIIDKKFAAKGVSFLLEKVENNEGVFRNNWGNLQMLIGDIPDFYGVWGVVIEICYELEEVMG